MDDRPKGRTTAQRLGLITASLVLGSVGWFLMGETETLTAAEPTEDKILARVDGVAITENEIRELAAPALERLEAQKREVLAEALRQQVERHLLEQEAARRGLTLDEMLEEEVVDRFEEADSLDLEAFAAANGLDDFDADELRQLLLENHRQEAYRHLVAELMRQSDVEMEAPTGLPPELAQATTAQLARRPG